MSLSLVCYRYVRSFNPPVVPHIKVEPSQYCDVNLGYDENGEEEDVKADFENGEYSQWIGTLMALLAITRFITITQNLLY